MATTSNTGTTSKAAEDKAEDIDLTDVTTAYSIPMDSEHAALALAAADDLGVSQEVIRVTDGGFSGPKAVIYKAFPEVKTADAARERAAKKEGE